MNKIQTNTSLSENLKDILCNHCEEDANRKGLLLLTLPTGFGKTYYVLQYIAHHIKEGLTPRIWFITNLKKNLPLDELKEMIGEELFNEHVVFLNSYAQQVQDYFNSGNDIDHSIKDRLSSYGPLRKAIEALKNAPKHSEFQSFLQKELAKKERHFRAELKSYLNDRLPSKTTHAERLDFLRQTPELRWVEEMYPSVLYFEKKVFFCSVDKFYRYVDTIVGPNIQITTPGYIENNIVFIDEFDATKDNVKNAIIENAIKFNQNIIKLFTTIYYGLTSRSFPKNRIHGAPDSKMEYLENKFLEIRETSIELYKNFQFHAHYYFPKYSQIDRAFLFHDLEYLTVFDSKGEEHIRGYLERYSVPGEETNFIRAAENQPEEDSNNLLLIINQLRGLISLFSFFVSDFAKVYKEVHDKDNPEEISIENAIKTTLDLFDINDSKTQDYFIDHIFQQVHVTNISASTQFDLSPVNKGFRYYNFVNRKQHDATTHILYADTLTTAETWLLNLCQNAVVIGISATAGFDSPISNYALSHLKHHLRDKFYELTQRDQETLKNEFHDKNIHSDRRKIKPISIDVKNSPQLCIEELFSEKEIQNHFLEAFSDLEIYQVQRYIKTAKAYTYFVQKKDINSFLCLLNKFPKDGRSENFQERLLKELFSELRIEILGENIEEAKKQVEHELEILNSQDFEDRQAEINDKLKEGNRVFVISTYQTIGAGQNIQYLPHEEIPVVAINDLDYGNGKKDYDAIYLEKPTNLLNYFIDGKEIEDKELLNYLFEVEYLTEGGAINLKEKHKRIRYAFKRKHRKRGIAPSNKHLIKRRVVALHYSRILIQAIGRLSRTKLKSPVTHILYDTQIQEYLKHFQQEGFLLVKEFEALYKHCLSDTPSTVGDNLDIENLNIYHSLTFATLLRRLVRDIPNWKGNTIKFWTDLRQFALRHPTISKKDLLKSKSQKFYIQSPDRRLCNKYFYHSKDDFRHDLTIGFEKATGKEVSSESACLSQLMKIDFIREFFEDENNNYATSFSPNEYILSPPLFQNIYLGALGEEIGKCILEKFKIELLNLEKDEYELFDFKTSNGVYVDFKFWGAGTLVDAKEQKKKIRQKMEKAGASKVIIINLIRPQEEFRPIIGDDSIIEIPGLICAVENTIINESIELINKTIFDHA